MKVQVASWIMEKEIKVEKFENKIYNISEIELDVNFMQNTKKQSS